VTLLPVSAQYRCPKQFSDLIRIRFTILLSMSEEKKLALPGGRTLAYADSGNLSSSSIFLFFHGAFSVGKITRTSPILNDKGIHFVAPTLPGWGNSSAPARDITYATSLATDIHTLINHLHPNGADLKLYIGGGSYGTVAAQILYGASYEVFPPGRNIVGLLLITPFTPFHCNKNYTKYMSWKNYISIGPPAQCLPGKLLPRFGKLFLAAKLGTVEGAEMFIRQTLFDKMEESERNAFARWRDSKGLAEGQLEHEMAQNVVRSVAKGWDGFLDIPNVLHSDWGGFTPAGLDNEHGRRPILVVTSKGDVLAPEAWATYLVNNYKNARMKVIEGGHLAPRFHLDDILEEFIELSL
jgi:pimeloyl-ACP methyl ester carboxylesterase